MVCFRFGHVATPTLHRNITNNDLLLDSGPFIFLQLMCVLLRHVLFASSCLNEEKVICYQLELGK